MITADNTPTTRIDDITAQLHRVLVELCVPNPEIKCLATVVTWQGALNTVGIPVGVWIGADGNPVNDPAGIVGSVFQTIRMLGVQFGQLDALAQTLDAITVATSNNLRTIQEQLRVKTDELTKLEQEIEKRKKETESQT